MRAATAIAVSWLSVACGAPGGADSDGVDASDPLSLSDAASDAADVDEDAGDAAALGEQLDEAALRTLLHVPERMQLPLIPSVNPPSAAKVELGRFLFYDPQLSYNGTTSCATCHDQKLGFADGLTRPQGASGATLPRNGPGLQNVAYLASLTWASRSLVRLEDQVRVPILGDNPIELGVSDANREEVLARFADDADYARRFAAAYPDTTSGPTVDKFVFAWLPSCAR